MKRKVSRLIYYTIKFFINLLAYVNSRLYMLCYNQLLKTTSIRISGTPRFIAASVKFDDFDKIILNDRLVVSMNVHFLTHDYSYTTSLIAAGSSPGSDIALVKEIYVGENVFIGMNCIILPGTRIGNNVIIGAGSVVRGDIPDFSIVIGNPAKIVADVRDYAEKIKNKTNIEFRYD